VTRSKLLRTTIVSFAGAAVVGQSAFAAGEPKNQWPFTRPVATRAAQAAAHPTARHEPAIQGEAKNELPFTRPASVVVVANDSGTGFDWTAGGIGAAAGLGLALTGAGAVLVTRKSPRTA
jgi:hypothetical protein